MGIFAQESCAAHAVGGFGGNNGMTGFSLLFGWPMAAPATGLGLAGILLGTRVVALFPALREIRHRRGGTLSGGQHQLALARALATRRRLLLDQPTEGIQPSIVAVIEEVIGLKGRISVPLVEQHLDFAIRLADAFVVLSRVVLSRVVLSRGSVVAQGDRAALSRAALSRHIAV
ncbi:hypothetical protein [Methylobacterium sp. WSM2598]|uniref:hypothetical protein n=1 Tax=Methylobacterium sp. WSM2598 TaxID=398261 RepID=UPI00037F4F03